MGVRWSRSSSTAVASAGSIVANLDGIATRRDVDAGRHPEDSLRSARTAPTLIPTKSLGIDERNIDRPAPGRTPPLTHELTTTIAPALAAASQPVAAEPGRTASTATSPRPAFH